MSYSYRDGKDEVHFLTEEDLENLVDDEPSKDDRNAEVHEQYPGAVSPDGEINWECPCLGGLGTEGPCVDDFRSAFSCWLYSESAEKGEDCVENFFAMSNCMQKNQEFYDDLNMRNKAEAEEATAKYEEEELVKLENAKEQQLTIEGEEVTSTMETAEEAVRISEVVESAEKLSIKSSFKETAPEPIVIVESSIKSQRSIASDDAFSKVGFGKQNTMIVAASVEEDEEEEEEEGGKDPGE